MNILLVIITVVALYALFKALTSTIDVIFKVVLGILILSFLGYSFVGLTDTGAIQNKLLMNETVMANETLPLNETTDINSTVQDSIENKTEEFYNNIINETIKEKNITDSY